jgi:hypothetical protein
MFKFLLSQFVKAKGRSPNAIEMLQLKFKASQQVGKGEVVPFPPERITDWTKARPQPPEIEIIDGVQTTRGMGDLFERQMKNIGKKDPALYEDRGGNIIPTQFKDATKETEAQILQKLNKGNQEGIERLKNKPLDPDDVLPNYNETPGEYSRRKTPGSKENLLQELKIAYEKEFNRLRGDETVEELKEILKNLDTDGVPFAAGGRAGLYQGGQAKIEPDLSGIGHGSDALMSRNMLIAPGSQATTSTGLNYLLGEDNDTTRVPYKDAGPVVLPKPKPNADPFVELQRIYDLYQESMPGVSQETQKYLQQDFIQKLNDAGISQEQFMTNQMQNNFANGGPARQNFKMGKRAFLKLIGGVGAGIAGIKTGLLGFGKKEVAKSVIAPAAQAANEAAIPPYFFKLVNKIKSLGDDVTEKAATLDRQKVTKYKDFELTEDVSTGQIEIQRMKVTDPESASYYGQALTEESYMSYKPGETIIGKGNKPIKTQPEYQEGTAHIRSDGMNAGEIVDDMPGVSDDLIEEAMEETIKIGKADGGRIGYKLGKKVIKEGIPSLIKKVNKLFGKEVVTTADKLPIPKKTLDRDMFKAADTRLNKKRQLTDEEIQDYEMELGDSETWMSEGTVGEAENALKNYKAYQDDMYQQYKMGKLDPVAGDKSPARKRFLEQKLADMEASGDKRLMTRDEIEELSTFDLGTQMDQMKEVDISQGMIDLDKIKKLPKIDDKLLKNYNDEIKRGVAEIMSDTSPEALKKSIEIDNLMLKYEGMDRPLAEQIATEINPRKKADIIAMVEQTIKMGEEGMSGDDIIQTFKNTPRTKQATGGLAAMLGE